MRFKNLETGNILSTENKSTIALMQASDNYVEVADAPAPAPAPKKKSLADMTKDELIALAEANGVDISACTKNAERIEALKAAGIN